MADHANTTPSAISRRFLFSVAAVAAAAPLAAVTIASSMAAPVTSNPLETLLQAYRDVGLRLQALDGELAAAMDAIPEWARPGIGVTGALCRWAEWTRGELDALGLPSNMNSRPSLADFQEFNRKRRLAAPHDEAGMRERHSARVAAWMTKRREQAAWFRRAGVTALQHQRQDAFARKDAIERELLALVTAPVPNTPA
jgi:hypothetical protein